MQTDARRRRPAEHQEPDDARAAANKRPTPELTLGPGGNLSRAGMSVMNRICLAIVLCSTNGCGGTSTTPGVACPTLALTLFVIYPESGSTNIVDSQNIVVVAGTPWTSLTLTSRSGSPIVSTQIVPVPSPLPEPNAAAGQATATAFRIPALAAATTYAVTAAFPQTGSCQIPVASANSFTTK